MKLFKYFNVKNIYKDALGGNTPGSIIEKAKPLVKKTIEKLNEEVKEAKEKLKDIPGTNYKLGLYHLRLGNIDDAILRFKMVVYLVPEMAEAYYNLGRAQLIKGDRDLANENLHKALSLKADFPEVKYVLGKMESPGKVDSIPENIIFEHLEYRLEMVAKPTELREQIDKSIVTTILANISDKNPNLDILDLGSNLGGRGRLLRSKGVAKKIVGVDIDSKATKISTKELFDGEPFYNNVSNIEISRYIIDNKDKYDVVLAGNVFFYQGNLEGMFSNISRALKNGGIFAMIIAQNDIAEHYILDIGKDKFKHSVKYIEETLKNTGFQLEENKEKELGGRKFNIVIARAT